MLTGLIRLIQDGGVVVLSGAGLSTDSGIPDYRGTTGPPRHGPMTYRDFVTDSAARRRYWARSHAGWLRVGRAASNPGHEAVATLERQGLVDGVITQNVDGLHQKAGSEAVIELHGSIHDTVCLDCGDRRSRLELHHRLEAANPHFDRARATLNPDGDADVGAFAVDRFVMVECLVCRGTLKPDVVFFGENVPRPRVEVSFDLVSRCRALVVLGSSLAVMSGFRFVLAAQRLGMPIAIVNRGPTRGDDRASIRLDAGLSETLSAVERRISLPARA